MSTASENVRAEGGLSINGATLCNKRGSDLFVVTDQVSVADAGLEPRPRCPAHPSREDKGTRDVLALRRSGNLAGQTRHTRATISGRANCQAHGVTPRDNEVHTARQE